MKVYRVSYRVSFGEEWLDRDYQAMVGGIDIVAVYTKVVDHAMALDLEGTPAQSVEIREIVIFDMEVIS
jgi:hypothetical protein